MDFHAVENWDAIILKPSLKSKLKRLAANRSRVGSNQPLLQTTKFWRCRWRKVLTNCVFPQGCVAIQILGEHREKIAQQLVNHGCGARLFQILEDFPHRTDLYGLAAESLYILQSSKGNKSMMLVQACKAGQLHVSLKKSDLSVR